MTTASSTLLLRGRIHTYSIASLWLIGVCFVLSGASGLIYEILWARMLGLVFGATTFAISAVLAAFMGGLALGSAVAGRLGARLRRPLRAYGLIEIGIALYALIVPLLFRVVDHVYAVMWEQFRPGFYAFSLWRFLLSWAVLLLPTALMGATLPVLSAALRRAPAYTSTSVARLYTCNLLGAIFGTLAAGFLLLPLLGVRATIWTAAAVNIIVGLAACIIDLKGAEALNASREEGEKGLVETTSETPEHARPHSLRAAEEGAGSNGFWLLCAAVSGFVTISTQVAWTRVLTMVIGSSTYAFSVVVALFLLGLSGGAYVVGRQAASARLRRMVLQVEMGCAASLAASIWMINRMPDLLYNKGLDYRIDSWLGLLALQTCVAGMLILIPAFLMGMVMPLVLVWAGCRDAFVSVRLVGRSYAVNTLGAIVGAFITGFILIPKVGTRTTILVAASLCLLVAGFAYGSSNAHEGRKVFARRALAALTTLILVGALFISAPRLNLEALSIGAYDGLVRVLAHSQHGGEKTSYAPGVPETHRLLMYEEGPTATVSVREDWGVRSMAINGRTNASDNAAVHGDMATQVMLGQLPLLLAPRTRRGLIVGFASGVSVGSMLQSGIQSLDCVELEPTTLQASRFFEHVNNRPLDDARLRLMIDDARAYLRVSPTLYDMIVSEPSHPWVPGVANLFTREFFELGRSRLNKDGLFVQWLQIYQLSTESLRSVLATYLDVFPHVFVFRVSGTTKGKDLILVGSRTPLTLEHVSERLSDRRVGAELARVGIRSPGDVESWYVCDETQLSPAVAGAVINTDDNMLIENRAPREAFLPLMEANAAWIEALNTKRQK
ncbi:MAG TPA: fused MFS/spermidine synthase [Pyrinomonadaceae bacterium]